MKYEQIYIGYLQQVCSDVYTILMEDRSHLPPYDVDSYRLNYKKLLTFLNSVNKEKIRKGVMLSTCYRNECGHIRYDFALWMKWISELESALLDDQDYTVMCLLKYFLKDEVFFQGEVFYNILVLLEKYKGDQIYEQTM